MNSIKKVSRHPITRSIVTNPRKIATGLPSTETKTSLGYAHSAAAFKSEEVHGQGIWERERKTDHEQIICQLPAPLALKEVLGIDKYFAEKRDSELIMCAVSKKLLAEEQLRRDLQGLSRTAPINSIVREHWRSKPSRLRPICPLTQEDL